jgi:hypothetical protein
MKGAKMLANGLIALMGTAPMKPAEEFCAKPN